jgi:flagellar FliL protein
VGGQLGTLLGVAAITLIAAGSGFFSASVLLSAKSEKREGEGGAVKAEADAAAVAPRAVRSQAVALPSLVANLGGGERWVRLDLLVLMNGEKAPPGELVGQLAEDAVALLRTLPPAAIAGPSGFQHLREDLQDRMSARSAGLVREVLIQSMILE